MKKSIFVTSVLLSITVFLVFGFSSKENAVDLSHYKITNEVYTYHVPTQQEATLASSFAKKPVFSLFLGKTFIGFKEALGFKESRGNYTTINKFGYLGKYQFAAATLSIIGVHNPSAFIRNAALQEKAFAAHTARNKWILRREINRFVGKRMNGVVITESGILAAAHLAGAGNVKKYLRSGGVFHFEDAFGTTIHTYIKKFSGYDTSYIKPDKKAKVV